MWANILDSGSQAGRVLVRKMLEHWQADPDLAGLANRRAMDKLPTDERKECLALWQAVGNLLRRSTGQVKNGGFSLITTASRGKAHTGVMKSSSCTGLEFIPVSLRVSPLAKGGSGGVGPANQAPGSRLRVGWTGGTTAYSEALGYALFTPPDPPFARGGNRSLAHTGIRSRGTKSRVSKPSRERV